MNSAGRALGKILSKFACFKNIGYKTFSKLFECNVESIIMYGAGIVNNIAECEKVQTRGIRYFLGLHPRCPIPALYGEMGWTPLRFKHWISLCKLGTDSC